MDLIIHALWFFLPAGLANAAPVFAARAHIFKRLLIPVDLGKTFRGKLIFGTHKTYLGILAATITGGVTGVVQYLASGMDESRLVPLGFLLGFGAIFGDLIRSFFKRQIGIKSGGTWFPFDQIDFIIGALLFSRIIVTQTASEYIVIICVWFLLHPITTTIGYLLKIRERPI
jgi:CDP-2,3-bis-(O-geranylgeranyl)-sn-glycerol synthase